MVSRDVVVSEIVQDLTACDAIQPRYNTQVSLIQAHYSIGGYSHHREQSNEKETSKRVVELILETVHPRKQELRPKATYTQEARIYVSVPSLSENAPSYIRWLWTAGVPQKHNTLGTLSTMWYRRTHV